MPVSGLLAHRSYTVRRSTALFGLGWLLVTTAGCGASAWYFLNKDDLAARLIARETARQYAYEDRIAALRADVDRLASRALLDQDGVEARVGEIAARQAELESRQSLVTALADTLQASGLAPAPKPGPLRPRMLRPEEPVRASGVTSFAPLAPSRPMPAPDMPGLRGAEAPTNGWQSGETRPELPAKRVEATLSRLGGAIEAGFEAQIAALRSMDENLARTQKRLRGALSETGLDTDRLLQAAPQPTRDVGGPLIPYKPDPSAGPFEATLAALQPRIAQVDKLRGLVSQLPLRRPMDIAVDMSSNFGHRLDPFTRGLAMHTGIDFRAAPGTPVHAAAPGKVVTAEYSGGYGNMVEIEHTGGVTTRYAHMSVIGVSAGQTVQAGAYLGKVGSTGRSTGPHLHYETRIHDEPVNPTRFLRAGEKLASAL